MLTLAAASSGPAQSSGSCAVVQRQMFGRVQAKLFPQYFATATAAIVLQMGTLAFGTPTGIARAQLITLGAPLWSTMLMCCLHK